ncbi:MAG: helix-turn-helix domain-containing protein [Candidatus Kerfeldbacteria bacterium]|nr:helix-turn-helix domain-containing protein [Candidatus Kerfeldbacteria bacterium]
MTPTAFNQRTIADAQTLGQKLKQVRDSSHLTLAQVSERLRIKQDYLEAIEQSRYTALPSGVFVKNYVQRYVKLLGLSWTTVEPLLQAELKVYEQTPDIPTLKHYLTKQPLQLIKVVIGLVIVFIMIGLGAYFGLEITNIVEPPNLTITGLPSTVGYAERLVTVAGQTDPEAVVSINDQIIPVLPDGQFSQQMSLQPGSNVLKIEAKTKRSQPHIQYVQIYVEDK